MPPRRVGAAAIFVALLFATVAAGCDAGTGPDGGGEIRGMVEIDGSPAADLQVELSGPSRQSTVTGSDGGFRFAGLDPGAYVLSLANVPGDVTFPATSRTAVVPRTGEAVISFSGHYVRTSAVSGIVRSGLRPLSGVEVEMRGRESRTAVTDGEGRFRISGLRSGEYELELRSAPSGVEFPSTRTDVFLAVGGVQEVVFEGKPTVFASLAIQSVLQELESGDLVPADPQNIQGVIRVLVAVAPGTESLTTAELRVGAELVVSQLFGVPTTSPADQRAGQNPEVLLILMTVDTREVDPETGGARFPNGGTELSVSLSTRESGPDAYRSAVAIVIRN